MNKGYIKAALALLGVAEYIQNIAFASEHASTTIPSNVKYKQQLHPAHHQVPQQLHSAPRQVPQQLHSAPAPRQVPQQLHPAPRQVPQQLHSAPRQAPQQLYYAPHQATQQLYSDPDQDTQQLYSDPDQDTQQLPSAPNHDKHKAYFIPIGFKQEEYFDPIEFKRQLALKSKEGKFAEYIMGEALDIAKKHAIHNFDYNLYYDKNGILIHFKRVNDTDIGKVEFTIPNPNSYNGVIKMLWDPNGEKNFNMTFIGGSISRMYNKNLVIVQHRYKGMAWDRYYHAIANKVELSRDETAIILVSSDMNDHSALTYKNYINCIVESANTFTPDIDSEEDIRSAKLNKFYINLIAFFIKREANGVKITHLSSIDHDIASDDPEESLRNMTVRTMLNVVKLRDIFKK
ncbi:hypothetical protein YYE_03152 [Plasmodium vinckei vinckei]|nr:hypothetical protein YYE_03152 [Plasmodium vinckei vinckei]